MIEDDDSDVSDLEYIAQLIEQGEDDIEIPEELLFDLDGPPRTGLASQIAAMSVGQRIKLALKGGREARGILVRDVARLVRKFVLQNPRISDDEIIMLCKNRSADGDLILMISKRKEWLQTYQIRLALCTNPKTPMNIGLRLVHTILERDLRQLAKSKNVPATISSAAKRIVIDKTKPGVTGH